MIYLYDLSKYNPSVIMSGSGAPKPILRRSLNQDDSYNNNNNSNSKMTRRTSFASLEQYGVRSGDASAAYDDASESKGSRDVSSYGNTSGSAGRPSSSSATSSSQNVKRTVAMQRIEKIRKTKFWFAIQALFTFIVILGPEIRDLAFQQNADLTFDIIFIVTLAFSVMDTMLLCYIDPDFFPYRFCGKKRGDKVYGGLPPLFETLFMAFPGSLKFWFDVASAVAFAFEINLFTGLLNRSTRAFIPLSTMGVPIYDNADISRSPYDYLLLNIFRNLRIVRFLSTTRVMILADFFNLYRIIDAITSYFKKLAFNFRRNSCTDTCKVVFCLSKAGENSRHMNEHEAAIKIQRAFRVSKYGVVGLLKNISSTAEMKRSTTRVPVISPMQSQLTTSKRVTRENKARSQVGTALNELTGERIIIFMLTTFILIAGIMSRNLDGLKELEVEVLASLHNSMLGFRNTSVTTAVADENFQLLFDIARKSSATNLYRYIFTDSTNESILYEVNVPWDLDQVRNREKFQVQIKSDNVWLYNNTYNYTSTGFFDMTSSRKQVSVSSILFVIFITFIWCLGMALFTGPIKSIVVIPIERMIRLLEMLVKDPLGYQSSSEYRKFSREEETLHQNTIFTPAQLKSMETQFLMSTILRIGSLMKVGFGNAGVEIIRNDLQRKETDTNQKNVNFENDSDASVVSCIFMFCDIRNFTDATESLQEEVFVFTNRIAAVVHSICHSYSGDANKNIGDAFLMSWLLDKPSVSSMSSGLDFNIKPYAANHNQADKALLSVVKIIISLEYENYFLEGLSGAAIQRLRQKLSSRPGRLVQMGCGLHAGEAVQGAIGTRRKLDATYISEAVDMSEYLESSTKTYGVKMLMSGDFYDLLHQRTQSKCRKIDQLLLSEDWDTDLALDDSGQDILRLYTFDMDLSALQNNVEVIEEKKRSSSPPSLRQRRMTSIMQRQSKSRSILEQGTSFRNSKTLKSVDKDAKQDRVANVKGELILPTGPIFYNPSIWITGDIAKIRIKYEQSQLPSKFATALELYCNGRWVEACEIFEELKDTYDDGPSIRFYKLIKENNCVPPRNFNGYGQV